MQELLCDRQDGTAFVAGCGGIISKKCWPLHALSFEIATGLAWHPQADSGSSTVALGTGAADCSARLWSSTGQRLHTLTG